MKKRAFLMIAIIISIGSMGFGLMNKSVEKGVSKTELKSEKVHWYTWEEAIELNKKNPKNIFVDVYTDWCGWCKKMERKTFNEAKIAAYLNKNYYPVKLDAEQKEDIMFKGQKYSYVKTEGRRGGIHTMAYSLLDGKMSYPTTVFLNSDLERIMISPGYKTPEQFMDELLFSNEMHYKTLTFDQFLHRKK